MTYFVYLRELGNDKGRVNCEECDASLKGMSYVLTVRMDLS